MANNVCTKVQELVLPIVNEYNLLLWDVEYVKEGSVYYLRIYIDKENDNVAIDDCENISRAIDVLLDDADFISESYYLEVCSAGLERALTKDEHLERYLESTITVKLYKAQEKVKSLTGVLKAYTSTTITIFTDKEIILSKKDCASIRLFFQI